VRKLVIIIAILLTGANAQTLPDLPGNFSNMTIPKVTFPGGISFDPMTGDMGFDSNKMADLIGSCIPKISLPNVDICGFANKLNFRGQICGRDVGSNIAKVLGDLCKSATDEVTSGILGGLPGAGVLFGDGGLFPSGITLDQLDDELQGAKIIKKVESVAYNAYMRNDQRLLKLLIEKRQKDGKTKDITNIKLDDLKAPKNMKTYNDEIKGLAEAATTDLKLASSRKVSEAIGNINASSEAQLTEMRDELYRAIDEGASHRILITKEAMSKTTDYAMPTEEGIKYLRSDYKAQAVANIYNQQMREAYIIAQIQREAEAQKNIVSITAEKQIILSAKFPREQVEERIRQLIEK